VEKELLFNILLLYGESKWDIYFGIIIFISRTKNKMLFLRKFEAMHDIIELNFADTIDIVQRKE
jgi:hypothetical protein